MTAKDDAGVVAQMIEWLGLEGDEASNFMDSVMERKGHTKAHSWIDTPEGGNKKDDKPSNVLGLPLAGQGRKASGSNWQY